MKSYPLFIFFFLAYLISWIIWLPLYLPFFGIYNLPILPYHHALGAYGPMIAAYIAAGIADKESEIRLLTNKIWLWKVNVIWYSIALGSPYLIFIFAQILAVVINNYGLSISLGRSPEFPEFSLFLFFLYNLFTFGYGEETGWRGFALAHLQHRFSSFKSTMILALLWAGWHLPLFLYRPGYVGMQLEEIAGWFISILTGALLLTWLYKKSKGSILIVSIFHATIDIAFTSVTDHVLINYMGAIITIWGLIIGVNLYLERNQKVLS